LKKILRYPSMGQFFLCQHARRASSAVQLLRQPLLAVGGHLHDPLVCRWVASRAKHLGVPSHLLVDVLDEVFLKVFCWRKCLCVGVDC
jgi:hypothetical protein